MDLVQSTYLADAPTPASINKVPSSGLDLFSNSASSSSLAVTHFVQTPGAVTTPLACVGNAASYDSSSISPGELVRLFGDGLGPSTGTQPQVSMASGFPAELAGVRVTVNGIAAPLLYVQDSQVNAIVPWEFRPAARPISASPTTARMLALLWSRQIRLDRRLRAANGPPARQHGYCFRNRRPGFPLP